MKEKVVLSSEDVETIINYSRFHLGERPEVYTTDKMIMRRFEKFANEHPELCELVKEDQYSMTWRVDRRCASLFPRAPRKGPVLSEEQKRVNIERLQKIQKEK